MEEQKSIHPGTKNKHHTKNSGNKNLLIFKISKIRGTNLYE
jgi:hypothetical protein